MNDTAGNMTWVDLVGPILAFIFCLLLLFYYNKNSQFYLIVLDITQGLELAICCTLEWQWSNHRTCLLYTSYHNSIPFILKSQNTLKTYYSVSYTHLASSGPPSQHHQTLKQRIKISNHNIT